MIPTQTAVNVRAELARRGLTQEQAGAAIGLNQKAMSRRLTGAVDFSSTELQKLAELLEVPIGALFGESVRAS
jgi:transcriptional regulator with XRE-family HTH domain